MSRSLIAITAKRGQVLIRERDPGDLFYIVEAGEVDVTSGGHHVAFLGPGACFCEIALLRDVPRTATVTARIDTDLRALIREDFLGAVTGSR